ncbi:MAG: Diacylglycerol kinase [Betaproteobacteria bacterium ADurb.Bin341]|nr:MAG: Diacylglycerol kinase [Betaproteobacteria bacterium ADurb.Bin341]
MQGLASAWKNEVAFRQELALSFLILPPGLWYADTGVERALLSGSVFFILIVELLNSAVEAAIDRISPERHPLSKNAKDFGSAAVLLTLVNGGLVWGLILGPKLF